MTMRFNYVLLLILAAMPGSADTILFQGTFEADNNVALFDITANSSETINIQTFSYGGGEANDTSIPAGGFAPTAFLFDNVGDVQMLDSGTCSQVGTDPTTENCDDLYFQDPLGPGSYTLALAVYDNAPVDTSVSDGFIQDGNPGFTCEEASGSGNFCDLTASFPLSNMRTGDYAIAITGADSVSQITATPEPGSMLLLVAGGAIAGLLLRRSISV